MYQPTPSQLQSMWESRHKVIQFLQDTIRVRVTNLGDDAPVHLRSSSLNTRSPSRVERSDSLLGRSSSAKPASTTRSSSIVGLNKKTKQKKMTKAERILGMTDDAMPAPTSSFKRLQLDKACSVQDDRRHGRKPPKAAKASSKEMKNIGGMSSWVRDLITNRTPRRSRTDFGMIFQGTIAHDYKRAFWPLFAPLILSCDYLRSQSIWEMRQLLVTILLTIETTMQDLVSGYFRACVRDVCNHMCLYVCMRMFVSMYVCLYACSCLCVYACVCTCICIHIAVAR